MANDDPTQDAFAALQARFRQQSQKAQAYYALMHAARGVLGSDDAASAWMEQPLEQLGGRTPGQLAGEGRQDDVLAVLRTLRP